MSHLKVLVAGMFLCTIALANSQDNGERRMRKGPPPEAREACEGKAAEAACEFEGRRGSVSGTCFSPKTDLPLACRPEHGHRGKHKHRRQSDESQDNVESEQSPQ